MEVLEKMQVTGGEMVDVIQVGRYECGVCGRDVGANSVLCGACGKWCHKRCSCVRSLIAWQLCLASNV